MLIIINIAQCYTLPSTCSSSFSSCEMTFLDSTPDDSDCWGAAIWDSPQGSMSNTNLCKNLVICKCKKPPTENCEPRLSYLFRKLYVLSIDISLLGITSETKRQFQGLVLGFLFFFFPSPAHLSPAWKLQRSRWLGITLTAQCRPVSLVCHPIQD